MEKLSEQVVLFGLDDDTGVCLNDDGEGVVKVSDVFKELVSTRAELAALQDKVRWRKVEDGLPESEKSYLVLVDGEAHEDYLQDGRWFSGNEVTHWMPLPSSPIPAEGENDQAS